MNKNLPEQSNSEEVDLGQLFKLIGNAFNRFFRFIGSILNSLFLAFVWLVFFIKKHIIKFVIAAIIGFGFGYIKEMISDPIYKSSIVVKQNYKTGENLYSVLENYNLLIVEKDSITLSNNLQISPKEAGNILKFEVEAVLSENQKLKLYDNYKKELDSVLATTIDFEMYVEMSDEYEYQFQKITVKSKDKDISQNVLINAVKSVEGLTYFKNEQQKDLAQLSRRETIIKESLKESDSLQKVYQFVLEKSVEQVPGSQTSVTIDNTEDKSTTKEFELYNKDIELRRELVEIEREKEDLQNIIEIVSSEQSIGTLDNKVEVLGFSLGFKLFYGFILAAFTFIVLLFMDFLNFLERFKNKI